MMQHQTSSANIRPAQPEEAPLLTALALESKAYWGYDAAFMAACRAELTVTPAQIAAQPTYVLEERASVLGFYMLDRERVPLVELDFFFVAPPAIGRGYGRQLFKHAVTTALGYGDETMLIQSDPNAEGFYRACGAQLISYTPSASIVGRMLPTLTLALQAYSPKQTNHQT
jgi:GNAT superfamily N-acetyltransferase